jgi:hypothetical protein
LVGSLIAYPLGPATFALPLIGGFLGFVCFILGGIVFANGASSFRNLYKQKGVVTVRPGPNGEIKH